MKKGLNKLMNETGQVEPIGVIVLIVLVVIGGIGYSKILSENRYVGAEGLVYDLKYCDVSNIPKDKLTSFENKEAAYIGGFRDAPCNK